MAQPRVSLAGKDELPKLTTFPIFERLPIEVRLMIWEFALPGPRIVHLTKRALRTDDDPDWWKRVRSDKKMPGLGFPLVDEDSEYGEFPLKFGDIGKLELEIAAKRLLVKEEKYKGTMTRAQAKEILRQNAIRTTYPPRKGLGSHEYTSYADQQGWGKSASGLSTYGKRPGVHLPSTLFGFRSESPPPALLLVCRESHHVASKVYLQHFGALGAAPTTYFNYQMDTLYLDENTAGSEFFHEYRHHTYTTGYIQSDLERDVIADDFAQVKKLAIECPWNATPHIYGFGRPTRAPDQMRDVLKPWLYTVQKLFPNLKKITLIESYFVYRARFDHRYMDLKLMNLKAENDIVRVNGYRVEKGKNHLTPPSVPSYEVPPETIASLCRSWNKDNPETPWNLPKIEYKVITAEGHERLLLGDAHSAARTYSGTSHWYINPEDPTDFEENVSGIVDNDLKELSEWY